MGRPRKALSRGMDCRLGFGSDRGVYRLDAGDEGVDKRLGAGDHDVGVGTMAEGADIVGPAGGQRLCRTGRNIFG